MLGGAIDALQWNGAVGEAARKSFSLRAASTTRAPRRLPDDVQRAGLMQDVEM
jgi:hypothetical protein